MAAAMLFAVTVPTVFFFAGCVAWVIDQFI